MHICNMCFHLHVHQRVSVAVAIIIRVIYKNIRDPNKLFKMYNEPHSFCGVSQA